jgi:hypothetical protein
VLHSFTGYYDGEDGQYPTDGLSNLNGTLYGTTTMGGDVGCFSESGIGCGTVFKLKP